MSPLASVPVLVIALLHVYILTLEMFLWTHPRGRKAFNTTPDFAVKTKTLAANQGLYNGFLAVGLFWGLLHPTQDFGRQIQLFFLACVAIAGVYGGITANTKIFFTQTVPAAVGIAVVVWL